MDVKQISNILLELGNNFKSSPACPILLIIESYMQNKSVLNFEIEIELRLAKGIFTEIILKQKYSRVVSYLSSLFI